MDSIIIIIITLKKKIIFPTQFVSLIRHKKEPCNYSEAYAKTTVAANLPKY